MSDSILNLTITDVVGANRLFRSSIGIANNRTNRDMWAIILKIEGKTFYNVKNKQILSDSQHPLIVPKGCTYSWKVIEPGECIIIEFQADAYGDDIFEFDVFDNSIILNSFAKIEKSLSIQSPTHKLHCKQLVYEILLFLAKSAHKEYVSKDKRNTLKPAIIYMAENYFDNTINNDFLASLCSISTVHFRKTFETVYGTSPIKYLHMLRINKAKSMLMSDYESINQVAESVGYSSIYHFSKMFKQYVGVSPSEYSKESAHATPFSD